MPNREELPDSSRPWWGTTSKHQSRQTTVPPSTRYSNIHHADPDPPTAAAGDIHPNTTAEDVSAGAAFTVNLADQAAPAWFENAMAQLNQKLDEQNDAMNKKLDAAFKDINKRINEQQAAIQWLGDSAARLPGDNFLKLLKTKRASPIGSNESSSDEQISWALTKAEKKSYNDIFRSWDTQNTGFISGETALEIFVVSDLPKNDLGRIWELADIDDRGKLNAQEFHVAMGLIYRRLNGMPVPEQLPPELIPEEQAWI